MRAIRSTVEALLIVELDGPGREVDHLIERVEAIARSNGATCAARQLESEEERLAFWAGRKAAFPAVGRISPGLSTAWTARSRAASCRRC